MGINNEETLVDVNNKKALVGNHQQKTLVETNYGKTLVGLNLKNASNNKAALVVQFRIMELELMDANRQRTRTRRRKQGLVAIKLSGTCSGGGRKVNQ